MSENEAENLLREDLLRFEVAVLRLIRVSLTDGQFDALVSFCFNLGAGALQRSTLRRKINSGYTYDIKEEFLKWVYVRGKRFNGLVKRRLSEVELFFHKILVKL